MTLTEHKIWRLPLILLLALWLGGCSMQYMGGLDEDDDPIPSDANLVLLLNVRAEGSGDEVKLPDAFEEATAGNFKEEMMKTLRVIIVDAPEEESSPETQDESTEGSSEETTDETPSETKPARKTKIIHNFFKTFDTETNESGELKFKIDINSKYKVYLIANEEGLPDDIRSMLGSFIAGKEYDHTEDILGNQTISAEVKKEGPMFIDNSGDTKTYLPMTEIFDLPTVLSSEDQDTEFDRENNLLKWKKDMFVTRAVTKFSFYFFRDGDGLQDPDRTITGIRISGLGKDEYVFPYETFYSPSKNKLNLTPAEQKKRTIRNFSLPSAAECDEEYTFTPTSTLKVIDFPAKPTTIDGQTVLTGLSDKPYTYIPPIYLYESKGSKEDEGAPVNQVGTLKCSIRYDDGDYLDAKELTNLPYALPRNTHVVVIINIKDRGFEAEVDVIPFTSIPVTTSDYGLPREQLTGYVIGKDSQERVYWYDRNYYQAGEGQYPGTTGATPYYLGPAGNPGEPVTINGHDYMLVYTDFERTAANLHHFYEVFIEKNENGTYKIEDGKYKVIKSPVKHELTKEAITGYEPRTSSDGTDFWVSDMKQRVVLEDNEVLKSDFKLRGLYPTEGNPDNHEDYAVYSKNYNLSFCRTLNEWDAVAYEAAFNKEDHMPGLYPKYWIDILGNRYPMRQGPEFPAYPTYPTEPVNPDKDEKYIPTPQEPEKLIRPVEVKYPTYEEFGLSADSEHWTDDEWDNWNNKIKDKYDKKKAEYDKYIEDFEKYSKEFPAYEAALTKYNEYKAAVANYAVALSQYNAEVDNWSSSVSNWQAKVTEWNAKLEQWIADVNKDKHDALKDWVKYLQE